MDRTQLKNTIHVDPVYIGDPPSLYGTRLSTVILIKRTGQTLFMERDMWQVDGDDQLTKTDPPSERVHRFQLPIMTK